MTVAEDRSRDRIQSIERGIEVLRVFGGHDAALSASEIVARVGLPRPVVRRILLTFEHLGYARADNGLWSLTPRILELGAGYFAAASLPEVAYRYMGEVVERTGETCSVGVLDGTDVIHVARVEERRPMPDAVRVGTRLPAHATAVGKVLLADLPDAAARRLPRPRRARGPHPAHDHGCRASARAARGCPGSWLRRLDRGAASRDGRRGRSDPRGRSCDRRTHGLVDDRARDPSSPSSTRWYRSCVRRRSGSRARTARPILSCTGRRPPRPTRQRPRCRGMRRRPRDAVAASRTSTCAALPSPESARSAAVPAACPITKHGPVTRPRTGRPASSRRSVRRRAGSRRPGGPASGRGAG